MTRWGTAQPSCLGLSDADHAARVAAARASYVNEIKATDPRVHDVAIDGDGTWRALDEAAGELCRGRSGASLLAQLSAARREQR